MKSLSILTGYKRPSICKRSVLYMILALLLIATAPEDVYAFSELIRVPWGDGPGRMTFRESPAGRFGPTDFTIRHGSDGERTILILDREQGMIQRFNARGDPLFPPLTIPPFSELFAVSGDTIAVWDGEHLHIMIGSGTGSILIGDQTARTVQRVWIETSGIKVMDERGLTHAIVSRDGSQWETHSSGIAEFRTRIINGKSIGLITDNGQEIIIDYLHDTGAARYLGKMNSYHVMHTERILNSSPLDIRESLLFITESGEIYREIDLPAMYFSWIPSRIRIIDNTLYLMISAPTGLYLYELAPGTLESDPVAIPSFPGIPYHFNTELPRIAEEPHLGEDRDENPITRSEIMMNACGFIDAEWDATSANITEGIEYLPDGSYVRTPSWVEAGQRRKVPYKWGGWTSLSVFLAGVTSGKKCGDDYTNSVSWTDEYCIGVDCSGYVSRCWNTQIKYGTSTIQNISSPLDFIHDLRIGDALNNPGSHIRLCTENLPSGMVLTTEASAYDWRTSYRAYRLIDLSAYTPIRFDWIIEEESATDPFVVKVKDWRESLNVRSGPGIEEPLVTVIESGQRFVSTAEHNGWYAFHIPAGTGTYMGWSYGGTTSINGYLEGDQDSRIATVTTGALNIRAGPGTEYAVITTASEGQRFAVLDSSGTWYEMQLANTAGFVSGWSSCGASGQYLSITAGGPRDGYGADIVSAMYPPDMYERDTGACSLTIRNIGSCSWDNQTVLRTTIPRGRSSYFCSDSWIDSSTICAVDHYVLPHQLHTLSFDLKAPFSAAISVMEEHFGFEQSDYSWFADTGQFGPDDDECTFIISVQDIGMPSSPVIQNVDISGGSIIVEWSPVNEIIQYGVFRKYIGYEQEPIPIAFVSDPIYSVTEGVGNPALNISIMIRAYVHADSSAFSEPAGEFDYALP